MVSKGNHPQMALIQVSEILLFAQMIWKIWGTGYPMTWETITAWWFGRWFLLFSIIYMGWDVFPTPLTNSIIFQDGY